MHNMHTRLRLPACVPVSLSLSLSLVVWLKTPFPSALGKGVFSPTGSPGRRAAHLKRFQGNFQSGGAQSPDNRQELGAAAMTTTGL